MMTRALPDIICYHTEYMLYPSLDPWYHYTSQNARPGALLKLIHFSLQEGNTKEEP